MRADCDNAAYTRIPNKTWHQLLCRMETRLKYVGRCCKYKNDNICKYILQKKILLATL